MTEHGAARWTHAKLTHVTTNTGHTAFSARGEVADAVVDLLRPLVARREGVVPGLASWHVRVWLEAPGAGAFQVAAGPAASAEGKLPYVMGVGCWREEASEEAWRMAHRQAAVYPPDLLGKRPPSVPWLAVTVLPTCAALPLAQVRMLGDFERCLFWTLVEAAD